MSRQGSRKEVWRGGFELVPQDDRYTGRLFQLRCQKVWLDHKIKWCHNNPMTQNACWCKRKRGASRVDVNREVEAKSDSA